MRGTPIDETTGFVFEVDSVFEVGLVSSLAEFAIANDYNRIIDWLNSYRAAEMRESREVQDRLRRLQKVVASFASFHRSYRESAIYKASGVSATYLKGMESALTKALEIDTSTTEEAEPLRNLFVEKRFRELEVRLQQLAGSDEELATRRFLEAYRRRLLNPESLVDELISALLAVYNRKVGTTRKRLLSYLRLLEQNEERTDSRLTMVERSVGELRADERLGGDDQQQLLSAFARRRGELMIAADRARAKEQAITRLLAEMRTCFSGFAALTQSLRSKLEQNRAREDYIWRLLAVGSEVPELAPVLTGIGDSLRDSVGVIQKTFLLLNEPFLNSVLTAIDERSAIHRITLLVKDRAGLLIEIEVPRPEERREGDSIAPGKSEGLRDLSFFQPIEIEARV